MIYFERSKDYALIRGILTQPSIWRHISDDFSPEPDEYRPIESESIWYVMVWDGNELLGLWMFHPHNGICWEVHTALLPDAYGDRARAAAIGMTKWMWRNTPCRRIITHVPANNRLALRFAIEAGMEVYGTNPASFQKGGKLIDQICLGISRPPGLPLFDAEEPAIQSQEVTTCQRR